MVSLDFGLLECSSYPEDGVDGGRLDSVSIHVPRVLNMQETAALYMSPSS